MKKVLLFTGALALVAASAFAQGGIDLSVNACPGDANSLAQAASATATTDCAGGSPLTILGTWGPNEAISDLSNLDGTLGYSVAGDLNSSDQFWDFDPANLCSPGGPLSSAQARPSSGCATPVAYTNTWNVASSGTAIGGAQSTPQTGKIVFTCYRPSPLSVAAGQKLFGVQIIIDASQSTEAGGTCAGCSDAACIVWNEGRPGSFGASTPSNLEGPFVFGNTLSVNGGTGLCAAVPTHKQTWGSLKSLYR